MTPAKRRPATPASQVPTKPATKDSTAQAPMDTPANRGRTKAATKDSTELLGPDGEPIAQQAATGDAGRDPAPTTETGQAAPEDRAATQPPRRSRALHPERVWPD